ncbi:MAG: PDZ domain-containing protein [Betaproteobacteria bacterium]|nr:MAG: PDZ domain-containing protein [Betaproteobacteria bacterium]
MIVRDFDVERTRCVNQPSGEKNVVGADAGRLCRYQSAADRLPGLAEADECDALHALLLRNRAFPAINAASRGGADEQIAPESLRIRATSSGAPTGRTRGRLFVSRLSPDGPGERAGLRENDIVLAVGADEVATLADFYRRIWSRGAAGVGVPLKILRGAQIKDVNVPSIERARYFSASKTY